VDLGVRQRPWSAASSGYVRIVPVTVRRLTVADDLARFGQIVVSAYHALPDHPSLPGYDEELSDVAGRVRDGAVFGAFDRGSPVGCVTYVGDPSHRHAEGLQPDEASFRMLAVSTDAQGRGVGEALVTRCLDEARADGRAAVFVYSGEWMRAAHRLYHRLGFVRELERDWRVDALGFTLLGYRRDL
jgi:ribosomal protein S18 acetylase RimI-like enzyme